MRIPSVAITEVGPMLQAFGQFNRQLISMTELVRELDRIVHFPPEAAFQFTDYDLLAVLDEAKHNDTYSYLGNTKYEFYLRPRAVSPADPYAGDRIAFNLIALPGAAIGKSVNTPARTVKPLNYTLINRPKDETKFGHCPCGGCWDDNITCHE